MVNWAFEDRCILVDRLEYQKERYQELASHHNEHCICDEIY